MSTATSPQPPPLDDALVDKALLEEESYSFDCKRLKAKLTKILETIVAFANSDGGVIALGLEDPDKGQGRDRVYGIQENPMNWDELRRLCALASRSRSFSSAEPAEVGCTLRGGTIGSVVFLRIEKSTRVHSIVDNGTFVRLQKGNKQLTAPEINELSFARGTITAESQLTLRPGRSRGEIRSRRRFRWGRCSRDRAAQREDRKIDGTRIAYRRRCNLSFSLDLRLVIGSRRPVPGVYYPTRLENRSPDRRKPIIGNHLRKRLLSVSAPAI